VLDIRLIRERPDYVKAELAKVGVEAAEIDRVLGADAKRRELITAVEKLRAERAEASRTIGRKPPEEREALIAATRGLGDEIAALEKQVAEAEAAFEAAMLELPNLPHPDVPVGPDDSANVVVRVEGEERVFGFTPQPHWDIGERLGLLCPRRARCEAAAGADQLDDRPARERARLSRGVPTGDGQARVSRRNR
jgi:seryl-tRNA synthetase